MRRIVLDCKKCTGCRTCEATRSFVNEKRVSRLRVSMDGSFG